MSRWERPEQELPAFRLVDMEGKVWSSGKLRGRRLIVGIWATWSAPCIWLLPKLQQLYEQFQNREDVGLLTMNVDEDSTQLKEWMQGKGFTFPVLHGRVYVGQLVGFMSVPRIWVVDSDGVWQWEQIGYDLDAKDWESEVLERLDGAQSAGA